MFTSYSETLIHCTGFVSSLFPVSLLFLRPGESGSGDDKSVVEKDFTTAGIRRGSSGSSK